MQHTVSKRLALAVALLGTAACNRLCDFVPTPTPHAVIKGNLNGVPGALADRLGSTKLSLRALAVDGRVLASGEAKLGADFTLDLEPSIGDQYGVRVLAEAGAVQLRALAPLVVDKKSEDDPDADVGEVGMPSTAATLLLEAYAGSTRSGLAGMPPTVSEKVLQNARATDTPAVAAYHDAIQAILAGLDPSRGQPAFAEAAGAPTAEALAAGNLTQATYDTLLRAAVDAVGVPVVCDSGRLRVMWTVDVSGQALDGNGKKQFMRQAPKENRVFLGITVDPSSPVPDSAGTLKGRLTPNDPDTEMFDDGTHGDEVAGDQIYTLTMVLPRDMRVIYKYTDGSPGEGYTGTEEWPGNARILDIKDVVTGNPDGKPDCLVLRRDSFGDESSNKNFVNLHSLLAGGALGFDVDLGGATVTAPTDAALLPVGGLVTDGLKSAAPLTPAGIPEARENGQCSLCPPPVTVPVDDQVPPRVIYARFTSTDEVGVLFTEDLDLQSASKRDNYLLTDEDNAAVPIRRVGLAGALVKLGVDPVDPRRAYTLHVKNVADASLDRNPVAEGTSVSVGTDATAPTLVEARGTSITEVNPAARPQDPRGGEVVVATFSEVLDRISAENTANYKLQGPEGEMPVFAAFQRGRDVLLVTSSLTGGAEYELGVSQVFDTAGNLLSGEGTALFKGLKLYRVQINAVPGFAWLSVDGTKRGLPDGEGLYVTGTVQASARATDGADIRVTGRTDVTGRSGYRMEAVEGEQVSGKSVHRLELLVPPGTYAFKLAHGKPADAANPPATLEAVTKSLCTTPDASGVSVNPITMVGTDGLSYAMARLSITGDDPPGPTVLFKRENPDMVIQVVDQDVVLPTRILGTWRDVPFGQGHDYDDGLRDLAMPLVGETDQAGPIPIAAEARDSFSVVVSFDEAISGQPADLVATISDDEANTVLVTTPLATGFPRPNQAVLEVWVPLALSASHTVTVARAVDAAGHTATEPRTVGFTSPATLVPFKPLVDDVPPAVIGVTAKTPTLLWVQFSEQVATTAQEVSHYTITKGGAGLAVTAAALRGANQRVELTTEAQEFHGAYSLEVCGVEDRAPTPNKMNCQTVQFTGFGDNEAPTLLWAKPVSPTRVVLKFSEDLDADSAGVVANYGIPGLTIQAALSSYGPEVTASAFARGAPLRGDLVVLSTSAMTGGQHYTVTANGVKDLAQNLSSTDAAFTGVSAAATVTVLLRYQVSKTETVLGTAPGKAISPAELAEQREGVFVLGTALTEDGAGPVTDSPVTTALHGFPSDPNTPLDGAEPQLKDDGTGGDTAAGDNVFTLQIPNVPLGSVLSYKAFASYSMDYRNAHSSQPGPWAFADATPGPSQFSDGQEYPGNDNAAWILADENGDGKVVLDNLFADETTFKRFTGTRPFVWVTDEWRRQE